jgi:hypothetical protein
MCKWTPKAKPDILFVAADVTPLISTRRKLEPTHVGCYGAKSGSLGSGVLNERSGVSTECRIWNPVSGGLPTRCYAPFAKSLPIGGGCVKIAS